MDSKLQEKYLKQLEEIQAKHNGESEPTHFEADALLCDLLTELGFDKLVEKYNKIHKWYA